MTEYTLTKPISPVTAAALQAELTHWLVAPSFTCHVVPGGPQSEWGSHSAPLVVDVGDRVTVPISDELPGEGVEYGNRVVLNGCLALNNTGTLMAVAFGCSMGIRLHPGGSLSGTVAAIPDTDPPTAALPIIANELPYEVCPSIHMSLNGKMLVHDEPEWLTDISDELPWQDFTPGMQAFWLTDVTVTP